MIPSIGFDSMEASSLVQKSILKEVLLLFYCIFLLLVNFPIEILPGFVGSGSSDPGECLFGFREQPRNNPSKWSVLLLCGTQLMRVLCILQPSFHIHDGENLYLLDLILEFSFLIVLDKLDTCIIIFLCV